MAPASTIPLELWHTIFNQVRQLGVRKSLDCTLNESLQIPLSDLQSLGLTNRDLCAASRPFILRSCKVWLNSRQQSSSFWACLGSDSRFRSYVKRIHVSSLNYRGDAIPAAAAVDALLKLSILKDAVKLDLKIFK
jgi:hypothetical protein